MRTYVTPTRRFSAGAALIAWLVCAALPATAAAPIEDAEFDTATRAVGTADLNLSSKADQAMLRHRINVAARKVCETVTAGNGIGSPGFDTCFAAAASSARRQANARIAAAESRALVASAAASR
jgi:UrcA family protein